MWYSCDQSIVRKVANNVAHVMSTTWGWAICMPNVCGLKRWRPVRANVCGSKWRPVRAKRKVMATVGRKKSDGQWEPKEKWWSLWASCNVNARVWHDGQCDEVTSRMIQENKIVNDTCGKVHDVTAMLNELNKLSKCDLPKLQCRDFCFALEWRESMHDDMQAGEGSASFQD